MSRKENVTALYGIRPLIEAIRSGKTIDKLFVQKNLRGRGGQELIELAKTHDIPLQRVPVEKLNRLIRKNHQGVFAFLSPVDFHRVEDLLPLLYEQGKTPLLLVLDRITDVRNFGAMLRTAACTGVDAVIIPTKNSTPVSADTVKTSSGSIFNVRICKEYDFRKTLELLKASGVRILAATEKTDHIIYKEDFTVPVAIVLGSEENGISAECLRVSDQRIKIPISRDSCSLNVSVACGMVLYEALRQRIG
ncbi:MAG: 23S rRNA (guanosine(2251)-2'-O)-methyltransferase RlmB [Flavobacteriales bacterium Tduv]